MRGDYLEDITRDVVFGSSTEGSGKGGGLSIDDNVLDPGKVDIPLDPPTVKKSYSFTINIANLSEDSVFGFIRIPEFATVTPTSSGQAIA